MAADTDVLPPDPAGTRQLPLLGVHSLKPQQCAVEVSLRMLGITLLRVRLLAAAGELAVTDAAGCPVGAVRLELSATPTRASIPLAVRLLRRVIPGSHRLVITLPGIELFGGPALMHADGTVHAKPLAQPAESAPEETRPAVRWPLCVVVRSIQPGKPSESDAILLAMRGRLRQSRKPSTVSPVLSLLRPWIRAEIAAEFSR